MTAPSADHAYEARKRIVDAANAMLDECKAVSSVRIECSASSVSDDDIAVAVIVPMLNTGHRWRVADLANLARWAEEVDLVAQSFGYDVLNAGEAIVVMRSGATEDAP